MDMTQSAPPPQETPPPSQVARQNRERMRRLHSLTEAQAALGWGIILALIALLGVIYLTQASHIAAVGRRVQILQNELEDLKRDNNTLERQIADAQSLERLQSQALQQGFVQAESEDIEYVIVPNYPAATTVSPLAEVVQPKATAEPITTMTEAIWTAVQAHIEDFIQGESGEQ